MKCIHQISLTIAAAAGLLSSCQQQGPYPLYFLTESDTAEAGASFNIVYNGVYYNRMPIMSLKHFKKFRSFLNDDGSYGVVLYVHDEYRTRLYTQTLNHTGEKMLPVVNTMAMAPLFIDQGITDGKLVIWEGLNGYDLKRIGETVEPMVPEIEEKRYRDEDPRPKREVPQDAKIKRDATGRVIPQLYAAE